MKKETVILEGYPTDPAVRESARKIKATGREVQIQPRPTHGTCPCGHHMCYCVDICVKHYLQQV